MGWHISYINIPTLKCMKCYKITVMIENVFKHYKGMQSKELRKHTSFLQSTLDIFPLLVSFFASVLTGNY